MQSFLRWLPLYLIGVSTLGLSAVVIISAIAIAKPEMIAPTVPQQKPLAIEPSQIPTVFSTPIPEPTIMLTPTPRESPQTNETPSPSMEERSSVVTPYPTMIPSPTLNPTPVGNVIIVSRALLTPTPTPTVAPLPQAQCVNVKLYRVRGTQWMPIRDFSRLIAGDTVTLAVAGATNVGIIDKARFRMNGAPPRWQETTQINPYGEYYVEYQLPKDAQGLDIEAQIHHVTLGWY